MNADFSRRLALPLLALAGCLLAPSLSIAEDASGSQSFVDDFDKFERARWYISDGWNNGPHQNCNWSKKQLKVKDGVLILSFDKGKLKDRDYSCAELSTKKRFSYGVYEARMKTDKGSGLNAAFFTYIGKGDKQPHDEIDFEVLTKDPSKVQVNAFISGKGNNEKLVDVKGGAHAGFNDYAFVWKPDGLSWYVNGELVNTISDPAKLPSHPQKIFFSLWGSDTLAEWMGAFADPGRTVTLQVDRLAFTALGDKCQFPESVACGLQ
jgi:endo-1,3-1,4-beta-glycanase ExoK